MVLVFESKCTVDRIGELNIIDPDFLCAWRAKRAARHVLHQICFHFKISPKQSDQYARILHLPDLLGIFFPGSQLQRLWELQSFLPHSLQTHKIQYLPHYLSTDHLIQFHRNHGHWCRKSSPCKQYRDCVFVGQPKEQISSLLDHEKAIPSTFFYGL